MEVDIYLGVDLGTSGVKALVTTPDGAVVSRTSAPLATSRPHPLWSEQDPEDWWRATEAAVLAVDPGIRCRVRAIGLAGQMHGATLLGADDAPLRAAILWNDGRSFQECLELKARVPGLEEISANLAMPGFTAPKLLWVRAHEPDLFARVRTVLLPKDYVRLRMTGEKVSDMSDASGTLWLDVGRRAWSEVLLNACGLALDAMPRLVEGSEPSGRLRRDVAARWGMDEVAVAGGGGDNAAGAVGAGVVTPGGSGLLSLGTSGVIFVATDRLRADPGRAIHSFCHCLPGLWHQMSVHLSAASCIDWVARLTGLAGPAEVFSRAEAAGPLRSTPVFLPYLSGERTPFNDARVRGAFLSLDNDTDVPALCQAVLEGVAFALADGLDALRATGANPADLRVIGGGSRSPYWGRMLSAALRVRLSYLRDGGGGPALGAARLARLAVGDGDGSTVRLSPEVDFVVEPDERDVSALSCRRAAYREGYPRVRPHSG